MLVRGKWTAILTGVLLASLALSGLVGATDVNEELSGTIEFMVWGGADSDRIERRVIEAFEARYPNVKVELRNPSGAYFDQFLTSIIADTPPDIAILDYYDFPSAVLQGLVTDLTEWAERDGIIDELHREMHPAAIGEMLVDGRLYSAANVRIGADGLFFNKDLFQEAGVLNPLEAESWTWDDMRDTAVRLSRSDSSGERTQWGLAFHEFFIWPFIRMNGGRLLNEDLTRVTFDEPAATEALQWLAEMSIESDAIAWNFGPNGNAFSEGRAGMHIMWVGNLVLGLRDAVPWDWDIAPLPAGRLGSISTVKGNPVVIPSTARNKELAWEFMKFLGSEEAYYIYGSEGRFFPMHRSAMQRVLQDSVGLPPANLGMVLELNAQPLPFVPGFSQVQNMWRDELRRVWQGEISVQLAVQQIAERSVHMLRDARGETQ